MSGWNWTPPGRKKERKGRKKNRLHPLIWMMRGAPQANGNPTGFQVQDAHSMMEHLEKCGMAWGPDLAKLANADGFIHVDQLPTQQIKQLPPEYGPDIWVNHSGKWVPIDTPEPTAARAVPDLTGLTDEQADLVRQEQAAIAKALAQREVAKLQEQQADPHVFADDAETDTDKPTASGAGDDEGDA